MPAHPTLAFLYFVSIRLPAERTSLSRPGIPTDIVSLYAQISVAGLILRVGPAGVQMPDGTSRPRVRIYIHKTRACFEQHVRILLTPGP